MHFSPRPSTRGFTRAKSAAYSGLSDIQLNATMRCVVRAGFHTGRRHDANTKFTRHPQHAMRPFQDMPANPGVKSRSSFLERTSPAIRTGPPKEIFFTFVGPG